MAWNPHLKVADCRDIARKWKKQQVIILAIDTKANTLEYASYGETKWLCGNAKELADRAHEAIMRKFRSDALEKYETMFDLDAVASNPRLEDKQPT